MKAIIYGIGDFFRQHKDELYEKYEIVAYVDRQKKIDGKEIVKIDDIAEGKFDYDYIVIMIRNVQECIRVSKEIITKGIDNKKIVLGIALFEFYAQCFENIEINEKGQLLIKTKKYKLLINSAGELMNVNSVLNDNLYEFQLNNGKKNIIFDIGMNVGDSTIYFSDMINTKRVFGYEPFELTYQTALDNLKMNNINQDKYRIFKYGISEKTENKSMGVNWGLSVAQSTEEDAQKIAYEEYFLNGSILKEDENIEQIVIKDVVEEFSPIIREFKNNYNYVLKVNCEGAEYGIIKRMEEGRILSDFKLIFLEWHYKGAEVILEVLRRNGFSYMTKTVRPDIGWIYAFK